MRIFMTLVPACLLVAGCSSGQGNAEENNSDTGMTAAAGSGVPAVAEAYRSSFDEAWRKAGEGTSPSGACAGVVGQATTVLNNADVALSVVRTFGTTRGVSQRSVGLVSV